MTTTNCPHCESDNNTPKEYINRLVKCPNCGQDYKARVVIKKINSTRASANHQNSQKFIPLLITLGMGVFISLLGALFVSSHLNSSLFLRLVVFMIFGAGIACFSSQIVMKRFSFNYHFITSLLLCVASYSIYNQASIIIEDARVERELKQQELADAEILRKNTIEREERKREYALEREKIREQEIEIEKKQGIARKDSAAKRDAMMVEYYEYIDAKKKQDELRERMYQQALIVSDSDLKNIKLLEGSTLTLNNHLANSVRTTLRFNHTLKYPLKKIIFHIYIYNSKGQLHDTIIQEYGSGSYASKPNENISIFIMDVKLGKNLPVNYKWNFNIQHAEYELPMGFKNTLLEEIPIKHKPW